MLCRSKSNVPAMRLASSRACPGSARPVDAGIVIIVLVVASLIYSAVQSNRDRQQLARDLEEEVDRAKIVCSNAAAVVAAGATATDRLASFAREIDGQREAAGKAAIAQEMITYTLGLTAGDQAQLDELNGARNRILLALQKYQGTQ